MMRRTALPWRSSRSTRPRSNRLTLVGPRLPTVGRVTASFLVRLVSSALAESRIVGQVRAVETGLTAPVRSADDLIAFLLAAGQAGAAGQHGHPGRGGPEEEDGTPT
jgi:hypothetical protein